MKKSWGGILLIAVFLAALSAAWLRAQVWIEYPEVTTNGTFRFVINGPTTNIRYDVYWTNALTSNATSWPLLTTGGTNQAYFEFALPDTNAGFFIVTSNYLASSNPPPKVVTPLLIPSYAEGNTAVVVRVYCETPGAVTYFTVDGSDPSFASTYIPPNGRITVNCATTIKSRSFKTGFIDSEIGIGNYPINCPPYVFAGNQQMTSGSQVTLQGVVSDDGQSQQLSNYWRQISGPATVTFGNRNATNSTATMPQNGIYVVQLESYDGFWTNRSQVTIARNPTLSVSITSPSGGSTYTIPTNIALEATASITSGSVTQVQFFAGSMLIGTATSSPFTYQWRNVPAGAYSLYAVASSTDTNHFSLMSSAVNITVSYAGDLGRFTFASTDLQIPVAGLPLSINRSYDPRYGNGSNLGQNQKLDYEWIKIEKTAALGSGYNALYSTGSDCIQVNNETFVKVTLGPTEEYYFRPHLVFQSGGTPCVGHTTVNYLLPVRFVFDPVGGRGQLASINTPADVGMVSWNTVYGDWSGPVQTGTYDEWEDQIYPYEPDWTLFTFTAPDGTQYKFDAYGKLYQKIDRNGNTLTYTSGGISHSSGKQITFTRDGNGRITEIKDPIAISSSGVPAIKYGYDANGNMTNVARLVDRAGAGTYVNTGYRYDDVSFSHCITRVIDGRGITTVSNLFDGSGRLLKQYDGLGNYTSYTYEDFGRRTIIVDKNSRTNRQEFTQFGALATSQNAEGAVTTYLYDANGRRTAEVNPLGGTNSVAYNEHDDVIGATNEVNAASSATYNSFGQPLIVIDNMGFGTTNTYDSKGNLLSVQNALGIVNRYGYDAQGNRVAETNAYGLVEQTITQYGYDQYGNLTNVTDALGNKTAYSYDLNGNRLTERRQRSLPGDGLQALWTTNVYDAANRIVVLIDPDGLPNGTLYNAIGKVAYTTNKAGVVTRYDYDARGLLTNTVFGLGTDLQCTEQSYYDGEGRRTNSLDRAGRPTYYTYDGVGRLLRTTFPDNTYTANQYDVAGRIYASQQGPAPAGTPPTPPNPPTTKYLYDAAGRKTNVINALNQTNTYAYDANGNMTNTVDALGRTTKYAFDRLNRQYKITYHDNSTEQTGYDALNRRIAVTNQASVVARYAFDALGRLIAVTNGFGTGTSNWMTYAYDEVGNQTNQVDSLGRVTKFECDVMGRRTKETTPYTPKQSFVYDAVGNVIFLTNFNGIIITNQYDALNRITNRIATNGYAIAWTYTASGQRASMTDVTGTYTYSYDHRDRVLTNSGPAGRLIYSYDEYGRLKTIASSHSGGANLTYQYDDLNRVTNVIDAVAGSTRYTYDGASNIQTVSYPNAVTNTYSYNSLYRLTNIVSKTSGSTLASFAYRLAQAGNRTNLIANIGGTLRTNAWYYDSLYRLTNETVTGATPAGVITYQYDAVGNRTNRISTVTGVTNQSFTYNSNDRLSIHGYDSYGSTTTADGKPFKYDAETRLTNFNNGAALYAYNGDGNRVTKTVGGVTTLYLVDDRNPTGYAQVLEELTVSGGATNLAKVYTYGLDLIAQRDASTGTRNFHGYDGNGNTRYLTSTNGAISDTYTYDAFGILVNSTGSTADAYRFAGEQCDSDLGMYYLRARYMNPALGRFWTKDLSNGRMYQPSSVHKYSYVANDPANRVDPSGYSDTGSLGGTLVVGGGYSTLASMQLPAISAAYLRALAGAAAIAATLSGDTEQNTQNQMRLQLQEGANHYWSQVMSARANVGVTSMQVRGGLIAMNTAAVGDMMLLDFPNNMEPELYGAIIRMSLRLKDVVAGGGVTQGGNVLREEFSDGRIIYRVDLENLRGHNLRR